MTNRRQLWMSAFLEIDRASERARWCEEAGFDGMTVVDSQCMEGDPYVILTLAATATTRLQLGTAVTNPYTRQAMITACAIASLQRLSANRAVLGIGRGDSALAYLGLAPASPILLESYLQKLQRYLAGEDVPIADEAAEKPAHMAPIETLRLAGQPMAARLGWLREGDTKVPVDVAAAGPKTIAVGARQAERVTFAVNADPTRLCWAIGVAREAAERAGRDPDELSLGAYISLLPHKDRPRARELVAGSLASKSRFAVMHGTPQGPMSPRTAEVLRRLHSNYDMRGHAETGNARAAQLPVEYIEESAIFGSPAECAERLSALFDLGLERIVLGGPSRDVDASEFDDIWSTVAHEVMPEVRA